MVPYCSTAITVEPSGSAATLVPLLPSDPAPAKAAAESVVPPEPEQLNRVLAAAVSLRADSLPALSVAVTTKEYELEGARPVTSTDVAGAATSRVNPPSP